MCEVICVPGRTPLIFFEIPTNEEDLRDAPAVMMYGHADKQVGNHELQYPYLCTALVFFSYFTDSLLQPPLLPWAAGLSPWDPVVRDGKLYGRGGEFFRVLFEDFSGGIYLLLCLGADDGYAMFSVYYEPGFKSEMRCFCCDETRLF